MSKRSKRNGKTKSHSRPQVKGKSPIKSLRNPIAVKTVAEFELYLDGDLPVIVDFWASWCGPCRMMAPIFEKVGKQFEGRVRFLKVSTEELPELSEALEIRAIPTLVVFNGRDVVDSHAGLVPPAELSRLAQRAEDIAKDVSLGDKMKRWLGFGTTAQAAAQAPN